jgi:energy-coupling factor transporter ATP-binding protein EcfA2
MSLTMHPLALHLKQKKALVIVGPQGSGKSLLARKIAESLGTYAETCFSVLSSPFDLGVLLMGKPATLILEEFSHQRVIRNGLKNLITSDTMLMCRRGQMDTTVPTPNFIFCSGDPLPMGVDDRRFHVVHMHDVPQHLR